MLSANWRQFSPGLNVRGARKADINETDKLQKSTLRFAHGQIQISPTNKRQIIGRLMALNQKTIEARAPSQYKRPFFQVWGFPC